MDAERLRAEGDLYAMESRLQCQLAEHRQELADIQGKHALLRTDLSEAVVQSTKAVAALHQQLSGALEKLTSRLSSDLQESARQQSVAREQALQSINMELAALRDELHGESAQLLRRIKDSTEDLGLLAGDVEGQFQKIRSQFEKVLERIAQAAGKAAAVEAQMGTAQKAVKQSFLQLQEHIKKIQTASMEAISSGTDALRKEMDGLHGSIHDELVSIQQVQSASEAQSEQSMKSIEQGLLTKIDRSEQVLYRTNILNYRLFHSHSRLMGNSDVELFQQNWLPTLKLDFSHQALGYLAHKICLMEDRCVGRLAASVQDVMLRILLARHVGGASLQVLEIGSLFGIALAAMHENTQGFVGNVSFTSIDPLEGYYLKGNDGITGMPVSPAIFEHNMQIAGVPQSEVQLVQHLSTDPQAFEQIKDQQFDILVIDGDHTYDGVKFDFETFGPLVRHGGLVLFDDYDQGHWPDVTRYVDEKVKGRRGWKLVGADWHSIVFRRTGGNARSSSSA